MAKVIDKRTKPKDKLKELPMGTFFKLEDRPGYFWFIDSNTIIRLEEELVYKYSEFLSVYEIKGDTEVIVVKGSIVIEN